MLANIALIKAVWKRSAHHGAALLVLLALADFANERGSAWPRVDSLARRARISRRYCIALLQRLADSGEISIEVLQKDRRRRLFRLVAFLPALTAANSSGEGAAGGSEEPAEHTPPTRHQEVEHVASEPPVFDLDSRLQALAELLPDELPNRERRQQQILGLEGDMDRVEAELQRLDLEILEQLEAQMDSDEREGIEQQVTQAIQRVAGRLPAKELPRTQRHLSQRLLREHLELPRLSLFSPALDEELSP